MMHYSRQTRGMPVLFGMLLCTASLAQQPALGNLNELRKSAFAAELKGDYQRAADAFLELCEKDASESRWFLRAGDNLGKSGRFNDAMNLLQKARDQFTDVPELGVMLCKTFHLKAEGMRQDGIWDDNVAFYYRQAALVARELLHLNPRHLEALLGLAQAEFALGDSQGAAGTAQLAVDAHPNAAGGHLILGKIHFNLFTQAKTRFSQDRPEGVAKADAIAEIHRQRDLATAAFLSAKQADPGRAYPMVALGDIDAWQGDHDAAFENYRQALVLDSGASVKHEWLRQNTSIERRIALYDAVAAAYAEAGGRSETGIATIDWYRALARFDQGDWREATRLFAGTLAQLPEVFDSYYYLMQASYWAGDEASAAGHATTFAAKARPRFADLVRDDQRSLAILRLLTKKHIEAERLDASRELSHVLAFATQTAADWNNYAYLCRQTGEFHQGLVGYEMALAKEPDSPQLMNDIAVILQHDLGGEENLQRARELYNQAIQLGETQLSAGELSAEATTRVKKAIADAKLNLAEME